MGVTMKAGLPALSAFALAVAFFAASAPLQADVETVETREMSFDACLRTIRKVASQMGIAPINIVETNILRMVRFPTVDGSVLVTCSEADRKMVITKSDKKS